MSLKDIKMRMQAITKTASITQAMHNIALSKIKKSSDLLNNTRAFVVKLHGILAYANQNQQLKRAFQTVHTKMPNFQKQKFYPHLVAY